MKRATLVSVLSIVAFVLIAAMRSAIPVPALRIETEIRPSSMDEYMLLRADPTTYTCRASVSTEDDPQAAPFATTLVVAPGKRESVREKFKDLDMTFTVAVNTTKDHARTEVVFSRNGEVVNRQVNNVVLSASAANPRQR